MKNHFKEYFNYSNSERKGTLLLLVLLLVVISGYWLIDFIPNDSDKYNRDNLRSEIATLNSSQLQSENDSLEVSYFNFNPNKIGIESWERLGFSNKQAKSIINYRNKGGYFYKKEDLKRLYVVNDSIYQLLEPYIIIPKLTNSKESEQKSYYVMLAEDTVPIYSGFESINKLICKKLDGKYIYYSGIFNNEGVALKEMEKLRASGFANSQVVKLPANYGFEISKSKVVTSQNENKVSIPSNNSTSLKDKYRDIIIDVNTADTTLFKTLKGIGTYYANKIVTYRNALGGFVSIEQLKEVYGISPEIIDDNNRRLKIDVGPLNRIDVNNCEIGDLKKHPYINWNIANSIVQFRKSHGVYKDVSEIKKSDLVNDEIYRKIAPYLKTEYTK